jgi:hypothetical protein
VPRQTLGFATVRTLGMKLPDVEDASSSRGMGLKVKGRLMACEAIHKSAEPESLMVRISRERRKVLLERDPATYYLTDHYSAYLAVLVRLPRIDRAALKQLLTESWEFVRGEAR